MLVLENLQWCDDETLDFLSFLLAVESRDAAAGRADRPLG